MTNEDGDAIVERFREAAMGMIDWSDALVALTAVTKARIGQLAAIDRHGALMFNMIVGCSDDEQAAYHAEGGPDPAMNPRTRALTTAQPLRCIIDRDFISADMRERTPIYNGLFRQSDVPFCAMVRLDTTRDLCAAVGIHRAASRGQPDTTEIRFMNMLAPAISGVVHAALALGSTADATILNTADHLSGAAILLGANLKVIALSPGAEPLLTRGVHVTMRHGRLSPVCPRAAVTLDAACAMMTGTGSTSCGTTSITFPGAVDAPPVTADLCPLPRRPSGPLSLARALLVFRMPRPLIASAEVALATTFGLTRSEAAIGCLLVGGTTLTDIAHQRGTSVATVRSQLKSMFGKTGCNRQTELALALRPYC